MTAQPTRAIEMDAPTSAPTGGRTVFPGSPALQQLVADDGVEWRAFRRTLEPRFGFVWCDLAGRSMLLALGFAAACAISATAGNLAGLVVAPLLSAWIGYWFGSIVLFMHEGAHYNLHPDKNTNDRLANAFVCILIGDEIKHYRALHWKHHLHLGDTDDTEVSYHFAPTFRFMVETLLGVHAWRVFKTHRQSQHLSNETEAGRERDLAALARGLVLHGLIVGGALLAGWYSAALTWTGGVLVVFPFVSALRQQLEHRAETASSAIDYSRVPHGAVNRMFAGTLFARSFGSAGFWRHLLHHWDPSVSYTRFTDFERFLMRTELAPLVDDARTTYGEAWRRLSRT